jgi:hypothetical protein
MKRIEAEYNGELKPFVGGMRVSVKVSDLCCDNPDDGATQPLARGMLRLAIRPAKGQEQR